MTKQVKNDIQYGCSHVQGETRYTGKGEMTKQVKYTHEVNQQGKPFPIEKVNSKTIMWINPNLLKKAIAGAYLDYYGENISDECVKRIINYAKELKENDNG